MVSPLIFYQHREKLTHIGGKGGAVVSIYVHMYVHTVKVKSSVLRKTDWGKKTDQRKKSLF
jgi:hypothetical protein